MYCILQKITPPGLLTKHLAVNAPRKKKKKIDGGCLSGNLNSSPPLQCALIESNSHRLKRIT